MNDVNWKTVDIAHRFLLCNATKSNYS